jgi:predicted nucleotidyltransferase
MPAKTRICDNPHLSTGIETPNAGKEISRPSRNQPLAGGSNLRLVGAPMLSDLRNRRSEILATARAHGATRVRVFGSVARGDATETSDIDFLVDLDDDRGLLDLGGLLMDLQELLGHNVDVVTEAGLRSRVAQRVLDDAVEL